MIEIKFTFPSYLKQYVVEHLQIIIFSELSSVYSDI